MGMSDIAENDAELGEEFSTARENFPRWRKRLGKKCPATRSKRQWRKFMRDNLLGPFSARFGFGQPDTAPPAQLPTTAAPRATGECDGPSLNELRRQREAVRLDMEQDQLDKARGQLLVAADLAPSVSGLLAMIMAALHRLPFTVSRYLVGLRDESEVEERLAREIDETVECIRDCAEEAMCSAIDAVEQEALSASVPKEISSRVWRPLLRNARRKSMLRLGAVFLEGPRKSSGDGRDEPLTVPGKDELHSDRNERPLSIRRARTPASRIRFGLFKQARLSGD
jgi:hypothetical protein